MNISFKLHDQSELWVNYVHDQLQLHARIWMGLDLPVYMYPSGRMSTSIGCLIMMININARGAGFKIWARIHLDIVISIYAN